MSGFGPGFRLSRCRRLRRQSSKLETKEMINMGSFVPAVAFAIAMIAVPGEAAGAQRPNRTAKTTAALPDVNGDKTTKPSSAKVTRGQTMPNGPRHR